jgi:2-oxoglutarate dehydrogenase E1 component
MNGRVQVTDTQMLEKVDTSYAKEDLAIVANAVGNLPTDKKIINKIQKPINDRKRCFRQCWIGLWLNICLWFINEGRI